MALMGMPLLQLNLNTAQFAINNKDSTNPDEMSSLSCIAVTIAVLGSPSHHYSYQ